MSQMQSSFQPENLVMSTPSKNSSILLFIDSSVENYQALIEGVIPKTEVIVLHPAQDGIGQITAALKGRTDIAAVHIVSHGSPGCLYLGNSQLSLDTLERYASDLQTWFSPSLFFYGCNVAAGDAGAEFIAKLHRITRSTIHASTTKIGNAALGGNWELDAIATSVPKDSKNKDSQDLEAEQSLSLPFSQAALTAYSGILMPDTDGDGFDDSDDIDDDNDGILDTEEGYSTSTTNSFFDFASIAGNGSEARVNGSGLQFDGADVTLTLSTTGSATITTDSISDSHFSGEYGIRLGHSGMPLR